MYKANTDTQIQSAEGTPARFFRRIFGLYRCTMYTVHMVRTLDIHQNFIARKQRKTLNIERERESRRDMDVICEKRKKKKKNKNKSNLYLSLSFVDITESLPFVSLFSSRTPLILSIRNTNTYQKNLSLLSSQRKQKKESLVFHSFS